MFRPSMCAAIVGTCAAAASAAVTLNSIETFDNTAPGASWGVGGDALAGWQIAYINRDPNAVEPDRFFFGRDTNHNWGTASGQPYPGTHSGPNEGTLLVQHDCTWGNSTDPDTGEPYYPSSNMIAYISFNSTAGMIYRLDAWVNSIMNVEEPPVPPGRDGIHPIAVNPLQAGFPDIRIGLKAGAFDPTTDFDGPWTPVAGLVDQTWVQTPTVEAVGTGGIMTIILQSRNPDTKAGANIMTDTWWDDVRIVEIPEPAAALLIAPLMLMLRRRAGA